MPLRVIVTESPNISTEKTDKFYKEGQNSGLLFTSPVILQQPVTLSAEKHTHCLCT